MCIFLNLLYTVVTAHFEYFLDHVWALKMYGIWIWIRIRSFAQHFSDFTSTGSQLPGYERSKDQGENKGEQIWLESYIKHSWWWITSWQEIGRNIYFHNIYDLGEEGSDNERKSRSHARVKLPPFNQFREDGLWSCYVHIAIYGNKFQQLLNYLFL